MLQAYNMCTRLLHQRPCEHRSIEYRQNARTCSNTSGLILGLIVPRYSISAAKVV